MDAHVIISTIVKDIQRRHDIADMETMSGDGMGAHLDRGRLLALLTLLGINEATRQNETR